MKHGERVLFDVANYKTVKFLQLIKASLWYENSSYVKFFNIKHFGATLRYFCSH